MNHLFWILFTLFLTGCNMAYDGNNPDKKGDSARAVRRRVAYKLKKEKELYPCGTGAQMMNEIQMLALSFNYFKPVTIEQSRQLIIDAVDEFVAAVNADTDIRPYLGNYPFEPKNIEIRIFIENLDYSPLPKGALSVISFSDGVIYFRIDDPQNNALKTIYSEPYSEAVKRLKNSDQAGRPSISLEGNSRTP